MKNFWITYSERDGEFMVHLFKGERTGAPGVGRVFFVEPPKDKLREAYSALMDIVAQVNTQSDFDRADQFLSEKFSALCERLGTPIQLMKS